MPDPQRKIRLCQLITELRPAGAERLVYELARRIDPGRFEVHVAALRGGELADRLAREGVPVFVLGVRGKWDVGKLGRLADFLRQGRFDLLHTHLFHADLAGRLAARRARVPHLVHTVHVAEKRFRPWQFAFARWTADWCDRIVCVSPSVQAYHARRSGLPTSRYTVIFNGVDVAAFARDDSARRRLRQQWGVGSWQTVGAFVGRLDRQKGVDTLLKALRLLHDRGRCPRVVVAGDGPQRAMVQAFIDRGQAGMNLRLLGFVDDVRSVLSAADLLVMPSRWEGFGLAAVEAMAASLPVVAANVVGLKDVVVDGVTARVVAPDDPAGLADAIEDLCRDGDLRARLGAAGLERANELFTIDRWVRQHEELYRSICESSTGGT